MENLHQILRTLYDEMMPLTAQMSAIAKGLAGLGALFYVAMRIWQALARAEPVDVYPLLRPFAIGLCVIFFPTTHFLSCGDVYFRTYSLCHFGMGWISIYLTTMGYSLCKRLSMASCIRFVQCYFSTYLIPYLTTRHRTTLRPEFHSWYYQHSLHYLYGHWYHRLFYHSYCSRLDYISRRYG